MERSRMRTPVIQRSKVACTIALTVGFGCAVFGVGGAAAGNSSYVRHVREDRLAAQALAQRSPDQVLLAIKPAAKAHDAAPPVTVPTTTERDRDDHDDRDDPDDDDRGRHDDDPDRHDDDRHHDHAGRDDHHDRDDDHSTGATTGTTTTPAPTDTTTTTPGTTTTTGTTTTPATTTTSTTTTPASTTTTDTTTTPATESVTTGVNGRQPGTTGTPTTALCHGRCSTSGNGGVVPASLPSATSSTTSNNFG